MVMRMHEPWSFLWPGSMTGGPAAAAVHTRTAAAAGRSGVVEPVVRHAHVREVAERAVLHAGPGQAVGQGAGCGVRLVLRVDERDGQAGDGPQLDRDHVV